MKKGLNEGHTSKGSKKNRAYVDPSSVFILSPCFLFPSSFVIFVSFVVEIFGCSMTAKKDKVFW